MSRNRKQNKPQPSPRREGIARRFWPKDTPHPEKYIGRMQPCAECNRVLLDTGSQAVLVKATREDLVYLRCRACDCQWKMLRQ